MIISSFKNHNTTDVIKDDIESVKKNICIMYHKRHLLDENNICKFCGTKITYAKLDTGENVNMAMKTAAGIDTTSSHQGAIDDSKIQSIKTYVNSSYTTDTKISLQDSDYPIYIEYDESKLQINFYTPASIIKMNKDSGFLFMYLECLEDISTLAFWDSSEVTNMQLMFYYCEKLSDFSESLCIKWDTSKVTDMNAMFCECHSLSDISNLKTWDVSKVTNTNAMFAKCLITDVSALSNWDVSKVTDMRNMFNSCPVADFSVLDDWDVSSDYTDIFEGCESITNYPTWFSADPQ